MMQIKPLRRMRCFGLMETSAYPECLMTTDGARNIASGLACKRNSVQKAVTPGGAESLNAS